MKMVALSLLLAANPTLAMDLQEKPSPELCVLYAMALMTGQPYGGLPTPDLVAELRRRTETCEPGSTYMTAAKYRLDLLAERRAHEEQASEDEEELARIKRQDRARRIQRAAQQLQEMHTPKPVTTTRCSTFAGTTTCTSQ